jgi:protein TonB
MFAAALLESNGMPRTQRRWITLASFGLQTVALMALVAVPVVFPEAMRLQARVPNPPTIFTAVVPEQRVESSLGPSGSGPEISGRQITLLQPSRIPSGKRDPGQDDPPTCMSGCGPSVIGVPGGINLQGIGPIIPDKRAVQPARPLILSRMDPGSLIHRVQPAYPPIARHIGVQGDVILTAIISKTGTIESLQVRSGHPTLVKAAVDAVRQWRYRPYVLNGERIEVETQITVSFQLQR